MPKTKISEFDVDPANNTDINSINIAEGCAPSGINNAIRQLMSDLKEFQTGAGGDPFNGAVNGTVGATTPASGAFTSLSASGAFAANGGATLGDASGDALTINSSAVSIPNGLNFDSNTLVIDATNNRVGVGTASPDALLQVSANNPTFKVTDTSTTGSVLINPDYFSGGADHIRSDINHLTIGTDAAKYVSLKTNNTERMRIDSSGNVGIGTSSPNAKLDVQGGSISATGASSGSFGLSLLTTRASASARSWAIKTNENAEGDFVVLRSTTNTNAPSSTALMLDSSGNLLVGTTSQYGNGVLCINTYRGGAVTGLMTQPSTNSNYDAAGFRNSSGSYVGYISCTASATSYVTSSDYRLKENIAPMTGALDKVAQLKPCTYTWKATGEEAQGFIAHELQDVVPDCVTGEKDAVDAEGNPKYQGIDTSFLVATLTAAIKEQQAIITDLKTRIETLESK